MNNQLFFVYLLIISGSTYLIRMIPFVFVNKKIQNKFILSFLDYIPYTVLTAMTFPAALYATGSVISAAVGLLAAIICALKIKNLTIVAATSCISVLICELILYLLSI